MPVDLTPDADSHAQKQSAAEGGSLDQSSIDAFFALSAPIAAEPERAIQVLIDSQCASSPSMPVMDAIFERLLGRLKSSIRKFGTDLIEIRLRKSATARFGSFMQSIPLPSILAIITEQNESVPALVVIEGSLVSTLMDVVFGGSANFFPPLVDGRAFSSVEMRIIKRLLDIILEDLNETFAPVKQVDFILDRIETNPRFATIAPAQSVAAVATFGIEVGSLNGTIQIVIPDGALHPIRSDASVSLRSDNSGHDANWTKALANAVAETSVTLEAVLFEKTYTLREAMALSVGETLMLEMAPDDMIELKCSGVALSRCRMGRIDGRVAVNIVEHLPRSVDQGETLSKSMQQRPGRSP